MVAYDDKEGPVNDGALRNSNNQNDNDSSDSQTQGKTRENSFEEQQRELALILDEMEMYCSRHLSLTEGAASAMTLWAVHTHLMDEVRHTPRLALVSPMPGCGKTKALKILSRLAHNCILSSNASPAAFFRSNNPATHPTFLLDEGDTFLKADSEWPNVLNSGFEPNSPVLRCVGENFTPKAFHTFAAVAIATIGELGSNSLESRAIIIRMRRAKPNDRTDKITGSTEKELQQLSDRLQAWLKKYRPQFKDAEPDMPKSFCGRVADKWRILLAIAEHAGGTWPERARRAALALTGEREASDGEVLLGAIRKVFAEVQTITTQFGRLVRRNTESSNSDHSASITGTGAQSIRHRPNRHADRRQVTSRLRHRAICRCFLSVSRTRNGRRE